MLIVIAIAGSESEEVTINQSGNAIDMASTVNLRDTFPDRSATLVLDFWNSSKVTLFDTNLLQLSWKQCNQNE